MTVSEAMAAPFPTPGLWQNPQTPISYVGTLPRCDHCYCKPSHVTDPEPHKLCCKCHDRRASRFVGADGR